jgi:hypothetical protein
MIRTLAEVQEDRERRRYLVVSVVEVSHVDDIYTVVCNGDRIGQECPHWDWELGDTSSLEDASRSMAEHLEAHRRSARIRAQVKNP